MIVKTVNGVLKAKLPLQPGVLAQLGDLPLFGREGAERKPMFLAATRPVGLLLIAAGIFVVTKWIGDPCWGMRRCNPETTTYLPHALNLLMLFGLPLTAEFEYRVAWARKFGQNAEIVATKDKILVMLYDEIRFEAPTHLVRTAIDGSQLTLMQTDNQQVLEIDTNCSPGGLQRFAQELKELGELSGLG